MKPALSPLLAVGCFLQPLGVPKLDSIGLIHLK